MGTKTPKRKRQPMKTAVFIDSPNQYYCVRKQFDGRKLDFKKLADKFDGVVRAFVYGVQFENEAQKFVAALETFGYLTRFRNLRFRQQRVSIAADLAVDAFTIYPSVDRVILVASSPDYVSLIEFLKERGVFCEVWGSGICRELKQVADAFVELDDSVVEDVSTDL